MQDMKFNLSLDVNQVNTVLGALSKQPYDIVAGLIDVIRNQAQEQVNAAESAKLSEAKEK